MRLIITLPPPSTVLRLLAGRRTVAEVERYTGWPAHAIHRLISRQRGWLLDRSGRVYTPGRRLKATPEPVVEPRSAEVLAAEVQARSEAMGLTRRQVAELAGVSTSALKNLKQGRGGRKARALVEAWLASTSDPRQEECA